MRSSNVLLFNHNAGHNAADLSKGSNTWQVKNYEEIAETVYILFLGGKRDKKIMRNGRTIILCLGSGKFRSDLFRAPWIIYKLVKRKNIKIAFTYEQVSLWWYVLFAKIMRNLRVVLMPIAMPEMIYRITNKSLSLYFPIWLEKILRRISSFFVNAVIAPKMIGDYRKWLSGDWVFKKKLIVIDKVIEEIPSPYFFQAIGEQKNRPVEKGNTFQILCVTRLRKEKLIEEVLNCVAEAVKTDPGISLHIVGEGEDREYFKVLTKELGIEKHVIFHGYMPLIDIIPFYALCDVYISAYTGSALREVALYGMPVVGYEMDWVKGTFTNGVNYLGVEPHNYQMLAEQIINIKNDPVLAESLRKNINKFGLDNWSTLGLCETYEPVMAGRQKK